MIPKCLKVYSLIHTRVHNANKLKVAAKNSEKVSCGLFPFLSAGMFVQVESAVVLKKKEDIIKNTFLLLRII